MESVTFKVEGGNVYANGQIIASDCKSTSEVSRAISAWFDQHPPHS